MNTSNIKRKLRIWKLRLHCWILWAAVEAEPAGSTEFRNIASRYGKAKGERDQAFIMERERRMNRGAF